MRITFDTNVKFNLFAYFKPKGCNLAKRLKFVIFVILIHLQNYVLFTEELVLNVRQEQNIVRTAKLHPLSHTLFKA